MLNQRHRQVLRAVVTDYIRTAEPVGSRTVARRYGFALSPATIRTIMADLEEMGYLTHPHTSAGRVPTDLGYRVYVDRLMDQTALTLEEVERIEQGVGPRTGEVADLLREVSGVLSALSPYVAVAMARGLHTTRFERVEFVSIARDRALVVLLAESGLVHHKVVPLREVMSQEQLDRAARQLTELLGHRTLPEVRAFLLRQLAEEQAQYDRLLAEAIRLGTTALEEGEASLCVAGVTRMAEQPEFADIGRMKSLFSALEEKSKLVMLLNECLQGKECRIFIGSEIPLQDIRELSVIAAPYGHAQHVVGVLAVVGPTRMDYGRARVLVQTTAEALSRALSRPV
jgi:heat-inducible transcriptional repressor